MLNIVIPMAGRGSRFSTVGYKLPKPLIQIHGRPMISYVIKNIMPETDHQFIFLCLKDHINRFDVVGRLKSYVPSCKVIPVEDITEGAACTVLLAESFIDNNEQLMIANSDQYVDVDINAYLNRISGNEFDGLIMTMKASDSKWSYIRYKNDLVSEVREKEVISDQATVGIYNFRKGSDFVNYAKRMIKSNIRVNGEFYVAPVYNEMINEKLKVTFYNIGELGSKMYGLGVPEDLERFRMAPDCLNFKDIE